MNEPSGLPHAPQYRLRTFGTLALLGPDDDAVLGKHGHHRRRLALLAALAAAGAQGKSRDQLLLFFWPDVTQSRARHSLEQLLYAIRGSIGESVFVGTNPVRLNPDVVPSDVALFRAALQRGDLLAAIDAYQGPFLDGFYLSDAPEFEHWAEAERAHLRRDYASALERLAQHADASADHAGAVRWWRKLTELDPVSSSYATGLIRAFMNVGDHPAALQFAERYEATVKEELGTSVGPSVAGLVAEVRAEAATERVAAAKAPVRNEARASAPQVSTPAIPLGRASTRRVAPRRWLPYALGVIATAVVAAATVAWFGAPASDAAATGEEIASIAVLPFASVGTDQAEAVIVDGLSEELMAALWRIPNLRVIARNSAFAFRNSRADVRRIGDSLGVANILEGSVQTVGSRMRVRVRLVNARDGSTRWSNAYDREREAIFIVQSEIAAAVARELGLPLGAATAQTLRRGLTENIAAHELYLRGRDHVYMRATSDSIPLAALALLEQAIALDSNFAAAYAAMPYLYFTLSSRAPNVDRARELKRLALAAAHKAISLDSTLAAAHTGLAVALAIGTPDFGGAEAALRRSIALGGTPRVREHLSRVLMWSGRHGEALTEALRAAEEDPLSASAAADLGEAFCVNGRYEEGFAQLARAKVEPPLRRLSGYTALCYAMQSRWREALAALGNETPGGDPWSSMAGYYLARSGAVGEATQLQSEMIEHWRKTGLGAHGVVYTAAGLDDYDQVFVWLDRATEQSGMSSIMYPLFTRVQADPRFERYRRRVGLQNR